MIIFKNYEILNCCSDHGKGHSCVVFNEIIAEMMAASEEAQEVVEEDKASSPPLWRRAT